VSIEAPGTAGQAPAYRLIASLVRSDSLVVRGDSWSTLRAPREARTDLLNVLGGKLPLRVARPTLSGRERLCFP
jgi:hypothetical protein